MKNILDKGADSNSSNSKMVEGILKKNHEFTSKKVLRHALPRRISVKELDDILDRLEKSCKITLDKNGVIVWIPLMGPKLKRIWDNATPWENIA